MFLNTTLEIGGAEMLEAELVRQLDRRRFAPEICCLKERGKLGARLAAEVPVFDRLIGSKWDATVLVRLARLFRRRQIDAVITVGAGDKMFWGRLAARLARVPVVISAIHSTGWPDSIGRLNRMLHGLNDAFVAVAAPHGRFLIEEQGLSPSKVFVIPNGVDTDRFAPRPQDLKLRQTLGLPVDAPLAGIVAALRTEKDHQLFLDVAALVRREIPNAHFLVIGDGALLPQLKQHAAHLQIADAVHFLGARSDVPQLLNQLDVVLLTSRNEANPVSVLEALACGKPVVASRVGSVPESVIDGEVGYLIEPGDAAGFARHVTQLFSNPALAQSLGAAGRAHVVANWSVDRMITGYEELIERLAVQASSAAIRCC